TVYAEVPPRVEYSLSELGETLRPILDAMQVWGEEYKQNNM
ncbi:MAG: winged helix-turn-helix transcriptional regulator, partial [Oscillospiraceae bacterium]|nr:winged helix-turn-helix transcriptional regulator [Oscillospiraceae bacterium]